MTINFNKKATSKNFSFSAETTYLEELERISALNNSTLNNFINVALEFMFESYELNEIKNPGERLEKKNLQKKNIRLQKANYQNLMNYKKQVNELLDIKKSASEYLRGLLNIFIMSAGIKK